MTKANYSLKNPNLYWNLMKMNKHVINLGVRTEL